MLYTIVCDINETLNDYSQLFEYINGLYGCVSNPMKNVWFIGTDKKYSVNDLYKKIDQNLYFGDKCFIECRDGDSVIYGGDMEKSFKQWLDDCSMGRVCEMEELVHGR